MEAFYNFDVEDRLPVERNSRVGTWHFAVLHNACFVSSSGSLVFSRNTVLQSCHSAQL